MNGNRPGRAASTAATTMPKALQAGAANLGAAGRRRLGEARSRAMCIERAAPEGRRRLVVDRTPARASQS